MKKGEKQTLIKSNVKINKKSEKLTKDEKEELEDLCQQIHIAMWESKKIPYCEIPIRAIADEVLKDNFKDKDLKTQSRRIYYMCLKQMKAHKGKNNTVVSVICVIAALGLVIYGRVRALYLPLCSQSSAHGEPLIPHLVLQKHTLKTYTIPHTGLCTDNKDNKETGELIWKKRNNQSQRQK